MWGRLVERPSQSEAPEESKSQNFLPPSPQPFLNLRPGIRGGAGTERGEGLRLETGMRHAEKNRGVTREHLKVARGRGLLGTGRAPLPPSQSLPDCPYGPMGPSPFFPCRTSGNQRMLSWEGEEHRGPGSSFFIHCKLPSALSRRGGLASAWVLTTVVTCHPLPLRPGVPHRRPQMAQLTLSRSQLLA